MGSTKTNQYKPDNSTMSLGDHLEELRMRLLLALAGLAVAFIICLVFGRYIIVFIKAPYTQVMGQQAQLTTLAPAEVVISYIKICLISGLIVSSWWVFYQVWMFVAAGLYTHEKRYVHLAVPFSAALFVTGALFFLFVVAPVCLRFFIKFGDVLSLQRTWTLQYYVSFITHLMLVFGLAFQTPTAIFFLNRTGLVSLKAFARSRKYVLLGIVIVAAIVTPPDVVSQIALAIPLYALFELGIILSYIASRKKA
ncbi:MAG TPA: twin-arginine translocase subunit TatC [Sedimentisphaerales bacterium]|nr:twin-arginine translocase subunit TatC [Sedimentisphaerales bacterium]